MAKKIPSRATSPDDYQTPASALDVLMPYIPSDWIIWEPACGKGNIANTLREHRYAVIASDKFVGEKGIVGVKRDFLGQAPAPICDAIITNPPYTLKNEFFERAFALGKPFAFLVPLTTLETKKRQAMFAEHGIEIIFIDHRINFETPSGGKSSSWFATCWITHGLNIGKELTFTVS